MYRRGTKGWAKHLDFMVLDLLCLELSLLVAFFIRQGMQDPFQNTLYRNLFAVVLFIDFAVMLILDTYKDVLKRGYYKELGKTLLQALVLFLMISAYMFTFKAGAEYSRMIIGITVLIYGVLSYGVKILWKDHLKKKLRDSHDQALLIFADPEDAPRIVQAIRRKNYGKHDIAGIITGDGAAPGTKIEGVPVVASYDGALDYITHNWVDEVLLSQRALEEIPADTIEELTVTGITVHLSLNGFAQNTGCRQVVSNVAGIPVITTTMNVMTSRQYAMKRCLDILGGLAGCIITGILMIFIAPAIKRESPGPVFFTQERVGKNGRTFKMYKFRSMYPDAEERKKELLAQNRVKDGHMFKMDFDPRIIGNRIDENGNQVTGIGEFIRKYSLDEFPQFYNVLKGDMSLVGTRPPTLDEYEDYSPHHKARLSTRPGITGLWQISGRSNILDFEEVVALDTEYINNWSIGQDIKILFYTVKVVLTKEGSL